MSKFKNKYTIESTRKKGYDYSQNGIYFVTICVKDRKHFFGEIKNEKMALNEIGKIVREEILQTPIMRPNVILDEWIIMPNHLHVVFEICNTQDRDTSQCVSMGDAEYKNRFGSQENNLSSIVRGFKEVVTKRSHVCVSDDFVWQSSFYDRIIRNDVELNKIREYIQNNPKMWEQEKDNIENIFM